MFWQSRAAKHLDAIHRPNCTSVIALPTLCKVLLLFSEIQILKLRAVSSASGSEQSEVTKYISCIFEAEFFIKMVL